MFKIIGADGRQYGPVTTDAVRDWIAAGRANSQTLAQAEGATEWKTLSDFLEFADALKALPAPPQSISTGTPPTATPPDPDALAEETLARVVHLDVTSCLGRGWDKMISDFWPIVGISTLVWALIFTANSAYVGIVVTGPLLGGLFWYYLKLIRAEPAELSDAFAGFSPAFLQLMLLSIVSGLLVGLGLMLCLIPGIYLQVAWSLALPLAMDKRLDFWNAMEVSRKVVSRCWWQFFALLLLWLVLQVVGTMACLVGVFVTLTFGGLAYAYAYEDLFGKKAIV